MTSTAPTMMLRAPANRRVPGLNDLLNWLVSPSPGIVICKDGSLLCGFFFSGRDLTTLSPTERHRTALALAQATLALGGEWSLHIDAARMESDAYPERRTWPDDVTEAIDNERRSLFESEGAAFETAQVMVLRWKPPSRLSRNVAYFLFERHRERAESDLDDYVTDFETELARFVDILSGSIALRRMGIQERPGGVAIDELLTHLRWTLTNETIGLSPRIPTMHLDAQLGLSELTGGSTPQLGTDYLVVVGLDDLPEATVPDLLHVMQSLPFEYRWHTRYIMLDRQSAKRELNAVRVKWAQQTRGWFDKLAHAQPTDRSVINTDAVAMQHETEHQLATLEAGQLGFGHWTSVIVMRGPDLDALKERARLVRQVLQQHGIAGRIETINCLEAFLGSLPGHVQENVRAPLIDTLTLANTLPLTTTWTGPLRCPSPYVDSGNGPPLLICHTEGTTPFRFSLHVEDIGHTLVFGATGSGKTTLLALLCAQWMRYSNASVFAIDKDRSLETLTHAVGGSHYTLDPDHESVRFAPLQMIDSAADQAWAAEWIEDACRVQRLDLSLAQRTEVRKALATVAASDGSRTVSDMIVTIQDAAIKAALEPYGAGGNYRKIFNGLHDSIESDRFTTIELAAVLSGDDKLKIPALSYLFKVVERQATGHPLLLVVDEAWAPLGNGVFRDRLREWLKTLRKKNVAVILATQSADDIADPQMQKVLVSSCPTRIFGSNEEANVASDMYTAFGLNEDHLSLISQLRPKREYLITQRGEGSRVVNFQLGSFTLAFCGVSSKEDLQRVEELRITYPDSWTTHWVAERNNET